MKRSPRDKAIPASEAFLRRLNAYALAASAAGVSIAALTGSAEAEIIYTKTHTKIFPNTTLQLDLNNDGIVDFDLKDTFGFAFGTSVGRFFAIPAQKSNQVWGHTYLHRYAFASAMYAGVEIGPKGQFLAASGVMAQSTFNGGLVRPPAQESCTAPWANVTNRYLGLKFVISGEVHFGWARFNVSCSNRHVGAVLTGYAYETVSNRPIVTGETKGTVKDESPAQQNSHDADTSNASTLAQPISLGQLAKGAAGHAE